MSKVIGIIEEELRKILKIDKLVFVMGELLYYWVQQFSLGGNL